MTVTGQHRSTPDCNKSKVGLLLTIFKCDTTAGSQASSGFLNALQKAGIVFQSIIEPFIFRFKPDQHTGWFSMPCDHDFLFFSKSQVFRQVIFDFR